MPSFSLGSAKHNRVEVNVLGYERTPVGEYFDDNWLRVRVELDVGAYSGSYDAAFLTAELVAFRDQLEALYRSLEGVSEFSTMEGQLSLSVSGDGRGQIIVRGVALDAPGIGNRLEFQLELDQTYVQRAVAELSDVVAAFPVRTA